MKHILAIGDVTDSSAPATSAPTKVVRQAAGPAVWVQQSDGSWAIRWRGNDTWWDLSQRYLQAGKRWHELYDFQSDAFKARVSTPVAIYTTAIVAMPPEAVQRAQLLGEIRGAGTAAASSSGSASSSTSSPSSGRTAGKGAAPSAGTTPAAGTSSGTSATATTTTAPSSGALTVPSSASLATSSPATHSGGMGAAQWWIIGGLGVVSVAAIGFVIYQQSQRHG